jgi:hypothetical protein
MHITVELGRKLEAAGGTVLFPHYVRAGGQDENHPAYYAIWIASPLQGYKARG